jgi:hypothetical protein
MGSHKDTTVTMDALFTIHGLHVDKLTAQELAYVDDAAVEAYSKANPASDYTMISFQETSVEVMPDNETNNRVTILGWA